MRYVVLIHEDEDRYRTVDAATRAGYHRGHEAFVAAAAAAGVTVVAGEALAGVASARTVRETDGTHVVTDGPSTETTEPLGGFYLLDAPDERTLVDLVGLLPETTHEIRACLQP